MSFLKQENYAFSTLAGAITDSDLSLTVATGDGTLFPSTGYFMAVLWDASLAAPGLDTSRELVKATFVSGDTFTIARAQEGTTAAAWDAGSNIALVLTAGTLDEIEDAIVDGTKAYAAATGTNTYAASLSPALTAYADGVRVRIRFVNANTGASTLNINALGAKKIYKLTSSGYVAIESGVIIENMLAHLFYYSALDSSAGGWILQDIGKVSLLGDETIAGVKTFSSFPVTPSSAPSTNYQVANKKFVSDSINLLVPSGTSMLFNQAAAPTGWTKKSDWANVAALHVGNNYTEGGGDSPRSYTTDISIDNHANHAHSGPSHTHTTGAVSLSITHLPSHFHYVVRDDEVPPEDFSETILTATKAVVRERNDSTGTASFYNLHGYPAEADVGKSSTVGSGSAHSHGNTGAGGTGNTSSESVSAHSVTQSTYTPRFVQVIAAIKD